MANKLEFSTSLDASGYKNGLNQMVSLSRSASERMRVGMALDKLNTKDTNEAYFPSFLKDKKFFENAGQNSGKGFMAGFLARMQGTGSGGISQLVHVFRATFDSLASGMNPVRVMMQQGPQAVQALMLMGGNFLTFLIRVVAPILAVGAGILLLIRHVITLARESNNLRDFLQGTTADFVQQTDSLRHASDEADKYNNWLNTLGQSEESLAQKIRETIDAMKEEYTLRRRNAENAGASRRALADMDAAELASELRVVKASIEQAKKEAAQAKSDAINSFQEKTSVERADALKVAQENADAAADVVKQAKAAMKGRTTSYVSAEYTPGSSFPTQKAISRPTNETDQLNVTGKNGKFQISVAEALAQSKTAEMVLATLKTGQSSAEAASSEADKKAESSAKSISELQKIESNIQRQIDLRNQYGPGGSKSIHSGNGSSDSLIKVGNFLGMSRNGIEKTALEHVRIARQQLSHLRNIDAKMSAHGGAHFSGT